MSDLGCCRAEVMTCSLCGVHGGGGTGAGIGPQNQLELLNPDPGTHFPPAGACIKAAKLQLALAVFQQLLRVGCDPDLNLDCTSGPNIPLAPPAAVCIKAGELELALDVFQQLLREGCTPNLVTYNILIDVRICGHPHQYANI